MALLDAPTFTYADGNVSHADQRRMLMELITVFPVEQRVSVERMTKQALLVRDTWEGNPPGGERYFDFYKATEPDGYTMFK